MLNGEGDPAAVEPVGDVGDVGLSICVCELEFDAWRQLLLTNTVS